MPHNMKVRYLKDYPDSSVAPGYVFKKGWTAEHDPATATARILEGACIEVDPETRARKLAPEKEMEMECLPIEKPGEPKENPPLRRR